MSEYVADTHTLHWHLTKDKRLPSKVQELLDQTDAGQHRVFVPSIILVEIIYLVEKGRLEATLLQRLLSLITTVKGSYTVAPLDAGTAQALQAVPRDAIPDMPDRIITATAYQLGLPLISRDERIQKAGVVTVIW
jgi:PIN domain nuclease of toxin-antitoxin system